MSVYTKVVAFYLLLETFHLRPESYFPINGYLVRVGFPVSDEYKLYSAFKTLKKREILDVRKNGSLEVLLLEKDFDEALRKFNSKGGPKIYGEFASDLERVNKDVEVDLHDLYILGISTMCKFAGAFYNEKLIAEYDSESRKIRVSRKNF